LILVTGELLVDIFPNYKRIGGAPFNFAYHLKNFGMPVRFISRIGRDAYGEEILSMLSRNQFDAADIQMDETHATGQVRVSFDRAENPEFEIMPDAAFDYIDFAPYRELPVQPDLVYFGTLIQRTEDGCARLQSFLDSLDPQIPCFYDINLRQGTHQPKVINHSLRKANIVKMNKDELNYIQREILQTEEETETGVFALMDQYNIEVLSLTRGKEGSELFMRSHGHFSVHAADVDPIVDTVGAGDAYAAVLALGYLRGWHPERILSHATMFSASICRIEGAVPEDTAFYQHMRNMIEGNANG